MPLTMSAFPRWLRSHRLAAAAWQIQNPSGADPSTLRDHVEDQLASMSDSELRSLPLLTLSLLIDLGQMDLKRFADDTEFRRLRARLAEAIVFVSKDADKSHRASVSRAARLVADALMSPMSNARGLAGLGAVNVDAAWYQCWRDKALRKSIDRLVAMHVPDLSTVEKVKALAELSKLIYAREQSKGRVPHWSHVEFFGLNSLFAWPLCLADDAISTAPGFSYPLGLDVTYEASEPITIKAHDSVTLGLPAKPMLPSLQKALLAAKDLWRSENGNAPDHLKERVASAGLVLDCRPAGAILEPFGRKLGITIVGESLEAYFATIILGRLSGISGIPPVAITGAIGAPVDRRKGSKKHHSDVDSTDPAVARSETRFLGFATKWRRQKVLDELAARRFDRQIDPVEGLPQKFRWAHRSQLFSSMVMPRAALADPRKAQEIFAALNQATQRNNALFVDALSTVADIALAGRWRRYRAVRAPDILHAMLWPKSVDRSDVGRMRDLLKGKDSDKPVRRLPKSVSIRDVVRALDYLNDDWRMERDQRPPKLSVLFFRMVHDEPRARLLSTLLTTMGAHPHILRDIVKAATFDKAVSLLSTALNSHASKTAPCTTPDLVVFILPSGPPVKERSPVPFDEHLEFDSLFGAELSGKLLPIQDPQWATQLNRTRILIVKDAPLDSLLPDIGAAKKSEQPILAQLATFRHAFSQSMASRLLGPEQLQGRDLREWLADATSRGLLCAIGGKYFLPTSVRTQHRLRAQKPLSLARAHMLAGLACAPYLEPDKNGGLADHEAKAPEFVHEAQFHLAQIDQWEAKTKRKHGRTRWNRVMGAHDLLRPQYQSQLGCFYETVNWDLCRYAVAHPRFQAERFADVVQSTLSLMEGSSVDTLPAIRITAMLGTIDKFVQHASKQSGTHADQFRADLDSVSKQLAAAGRNRVKALAKQAGKSAKAAVAAERKGVSEPARHKLKQRAADELHQAVHAAGHICALAMRENPIELGLKSRHIDAANVVVRDALLANDKLPPGARDEQLGYCPPPEWFAGYGGSLGHNAYVGRGRNAYDVALDLYRIGRNHRRGRIQRSAALFVNALGIAKPGDDNEALVLQDLRVLKASHPAKFDVLVDHIKKHHEASAHWKLGLPRFVQLVGDQASAVPAELVDEVDIDEALSETVTPEDQELVDDEAA